MRPQHPFGDDDIPPARTGTRNREVYAQEERVLANAHIEDLQKRFVGNLACRYYRIAKTTKSDDCCGIAFRNVEFDSMNIIRPRLRHRVEIWCKANDGSGNAGEIAPTSAIKVSVLVPVTQARVNYRC
jgi:hypothetical protein